MTGSRGAPLGRPDPLVRERKIAGVLFVATCISVFLAYRFYWQTVPSVGRALLFTGALMGFLVAHELGHVLAARAQGHAVGAPWFIPVPFWVGTAGAVIRWADAPRSRRALLDIAAAGPLAGFAMIAVLLGVSLGLSPESPDADRLPVPLLWWVISGVVRGQPPDGVSPQSPVEFAAWIGALVTAMNLFPIGVLDGGQVVAATAPGWAVPWIRRGATVGLLALGVGWPPWAGWAAVAALMGTTAPAHRTSAEPRKGLLLGCVSVFALCFLPFPTG